jgi:FkbM family methyltransferase
MFLRENTVDGEVFNSVVNHNEYKLPDSVEGWVVIDLGAHIGSFSFLSHTRGAKQIISVEPCSDNYDICVKNLGDIKTVKLYRRAIWNQDDSILSIAKHAPYNTGGSSSYDSSVYNTEKYTNPARSYIGDLFTETEGDLLHVKRLDEYSKCTTVEYNSIKSISLKTLITENNIDEIDLIKIDVEGSEIRVFKDIDNEILKKIKRICGEWHGGKSFNILKEKLTPYFNINFENENGGLGPFWAVRKDIKNNFKCKIDVM